MSGPNMNTLKLFRSRQPIGNSFHNTRNLFVALVFCMMCCTSMLMGNTKTIELVNQTEFIYKNLAMLDSQGRKLMFGSNPLKSLVSNDQDNLNSQLNDDAEVQEETSKTQEFGVTKMARMMLTGHYTYLTNMMLSSSSFFFWVMPNHHKIKAMLRPFQPREDKSFSLNTDSGLIGNKRKRKHYVYDASAPTMVTRAREKQDQSSRQS